MDSIVSLLAYTWTIEASDPEEAIYKAVAKALGVYSYGRELMERLAIEPVDIGLYVLIDRKTGESIVVRATEHTTSRDIINEIIRNPLAPLHYTPRTHIKKYIVTFYPRTYRKPEK